MSPSLSHGQNVWVNRLIYRIRSPYRSDIVVIRDHHESGHYNVKRILGLPGEYVHIDGSKIFIDGSQIEELYIVMGRSLKSYRPSRWVLSDDEYFVLGDNREESVDSRLYGPIKRSDIVGKIYR